MNILILTYGVGGRYDAAAENIREGFALCGDTALIKNCLDFTAKTDGVKNSRTFALRHAPHIYGIAEVLSRRDTAEPSSEAVDALRRCIDDEEIDAVISVHISGARLVSALKDSGAHIRSFFLGIDLFPPEACDKLNVDRIMLAHEALSGDYLACGADPEKLVFTGMPTRSPADISHAEARARLAVKDGAKLVLLGSGTLGIGPIRRCVAAIVDLLGCDDRLIVLCGRNERLRRELDMLFYLDDRVCALGMANDIGALLAAADVLVTTGGSMISAEAAEISLPVIFIDAIPGANSRNIAFLKKQTAFVRSGETSDEIARQLEFELALPLSVPEAFGGGFEEIYRCVSELCGTKKKAPAMRKLLLIMNPVAGKMAVSRQLGGILEVFSRNGLIPTVLPTSASGDAAIFAESYADEYDLVVCCGGDGTMSETAAGLSRCRRRTPVGYIPCGSTNDFAEYHAIPTDLVAAAKLAVTGVPTPVDMGMINGRCFINAAEFGVFTRAAYDTPQRRKNFLGFYAYVLEGIKDLANLTSKEMRFTVDGESIEGDFIFGIVAAASNLTDSTLEFFGQPVISGDGLFELVLIRRPASPLELECIVHSLRMKDPNSTLVSFRRGRHISVSQEGTLNWVLDGEKLETEGSYDIDIIPHGIDLICSP